MMERVRILVVATPSAPVRGLAARLRDPDLDVVVAGSAREALERVGPSLPDVAIIDGSLPGREVFRLYGRLRGLPAGGTLPIIFSAHERSDAEAADTTAPDFYLGPDSTLDDVEQLVYSFLPDSLVVTEELELPDDEEDPLPEVDQRDEADTLAEALASSTGRSLPPELPEYLRPAPPPERPAPATVSPSWAEIGERLRSGAAPLALAYLGIYGLAEVLAASVDARLGLIVHGGLLLAIALHAYNVPPGPERTFFLALWLAPLTRIYGLAQPYAGFSPLAWWASTAVPMVVAGVVAMRLAGQTAKEAGLIPSPHEVPIAALLVPVGLVLGVLLYWLIVPRTLARELASFNLGLVALVVVLNPGLVDELVFRGVMQRASLGLLGNGLGIVYTSLMYAPIVPAGVGGGPVAVLATFVLGLLLSLMTARTGSILSAAVAHAGLALGLFVVGPYWAPPDLGATGGPLGTPIGLETRPPATRPITVISGSPTPVPAPGGAGGPAGPAATSAQPTQSGLPGIPQPATNPTQTGLSTPGQASTPVSLAPPPPAPAAQSAPNAASPESSPAPPGAGSQQIVVVRGTGGSGARLRSQPGNNGPILTVVPEYTPLVVVGPDRQADGLVWRNVRAPSGNEGWIASSFVTPGQ
jgi:membrane protease YdiL (CAAX protease family)